MGHFIHILSSRLHLDPGKALFVFVKNTLPQTGGLTYIFIQSKWWTLVSILNHLSKHLCAASRMDTIYESFKEDDGFLYMCYSTEKTFG